VYPHGAWACDACGWGGADAADLERAMGGDIYSRHIGRRFGENNSELPIRTIEEVLSEAGEGPDWIIENQVARGAVTECSGLAKKGGKTTYWLTGIAAGASGEDFAGFATTPAKYLYLTEQGNNFAEALKESGLEKYPDHIKIVQFKDVPAVKWDELIMTAGAETKRLGFDALVVDTFAVFARLKGSEENDSGAVAERMRVLRLVAQTYDIAVVLIRHAGKDGTPRGCSAFEAEADICITISRPEGRHASSVRKVAGIGRYGEWERNVQLQDGRYISLGADDKVEFRKAVRFVMAILPESPESGMRKQEMLDKREGDDKGISARTLDRALAWLVEKGDVGEKQLMEERGRPKIYWKAYKPPGDVATDAGENKNIYSRQTLSHSNGFGENKPESENGRSVLGGFEEKTAARMPGLEDELGGL
jgi:hypothetical protein